MAWIRCCCEVRDISLWQESCYKCLVKRHDQIFIVTLYVPLKIHVMYLWGLKMEVQINKKKNWCFFQQSWDYMFFAVHRSVFNQCTKIQKLICHNLSEHCTACSPFPSFSSDVVHSAVWLVLRGRAAQQEEPLQWPSPRSWQKPDVPWHTEYMSWYVLQLTNHIWYYKVISNLVIQTSFLHSAHN